MKKRGIYLVLLLGVLAGLLLTGCSTSQDTSTATTEIVTEATTEATAVIQSTQPTEAVQESPTLDINAAAEGFNRTIFAKAAFHNYEIWEDTQDGSLHFVNLHNLEMLDIGCKHLQNTDSGEIIPVYSIELVNEFTPQVRRQYLPYFKLSYADSEQGYSAVDMGGKVAGLYGFSCTYGIAPYDSTLTKKTEWNMFLLGSMLSVDILGYLPVSVEYSDVLQVTDAPNSVDFLSHVRDDVAGFVIMPMEPGAFSISYNSVILYFDSLEHLAEYIIPQWEAFEATQTTNHG